MVVTPGESNATLSVVSSGVAWAASPSALPNTAVRARSTTSSCSLRPPHPASERGGQPRRGRRVLARVDDQHVGNQRRRDGLDVRRIAARDRGEEVDHQRRNEGGVLVRSDRAVDRVVRLESSTSLTSGLPSRCTWLYIRGVAGPSVCCRRCTRPPPGSRRDRRATSARRRVARENLPIRICDVLSFRCVGDYWLMVPQMPSLPGALFSSIELGSSITIVFTLKPAT